MEFIAVLSTAAAVEVRFRRSPREGGSNSVEVWPSDRCSSTSTCSSTALIKYQDSFWGFEIRGDAKENRQDADHRWSGSAGFCSALRSAFSCAETKRPFRLTSTHSHLSPTPPSPQEPTQRNHRQLSDINLSEPTMHLVPAEDEAKGVFIPLKCPTKVTY